MIPIRKPMECMVCGKVFPRGALDLARHTTAVTLKHVFSDKPTFSCSIPCTKCGVCFPSDEFLIMHTEKSSCGSSGSKYVDSDLPKSGELDISLSDKKGLKSQFISEDIKSPVSQMSVPQRKSSRSVILQQKSNLTLTPTAYNEKTSSSVADFDAFTNQIKSKDSTPSEKIVESQSIHIGFSDSLQQSDNVGGKRRFTSIEELANFQKLQKKQNPTIVPEDRKAYFTIVSLLVDKSKWLQKWEYNSMSAATAPPERFQSSSKFNFQCVTDDQSDTIKAMNFPSIVNIESFIPQDKIHVVDTLKSLLFYGWKE